MSGLAKYSIIGGTFLLIIVGIAVAVLRQAESHWRFTSPSAFTMKLSSISFEPGKQIPSQYTCDGKNISPQLSIANTPDNAKSLALTLEDPDAPGGTWDHWVVWNIDPKTLVINEGAVPQGATLGRTSFGKNAYGGPCPPKGSKPHRYVFTVYALNKPLEILEESTKDDLQKAMQGHILAEATLTGLFSH